MMSRSGMSHRMSLEIPYDVKKWHESQIAVLCRRQVTEHNAAGRIISTAISTIELC